LIEVLQTLADNGNTVLVIEHNLDIIKVADWLIDMGPEGGDKGGYVIATGTPEEVAQVANSHTGQYLRPYLEHRPAPPAVTNGTKPKRKPKKKAEPATS